MREALVMYLADLMTANLFLAARVKEVILKHR
jgi:hypothetical protein